MVDEGAMGMCMDDVGAMGMEDAPPMGPMRFMALEDDDLLLERE